MAQRKRLSIPNAAHKYSISKNGKVVDDTTGQVVGASGGNSGYAKVNIRMKDGSYKQPYVHKLVAKAYLKGKGDTDHKSRDKNDNSVSNLENVSHSENLKRVYKTGRHNVHNFKQKTKKYKRLYIKKGE